MIRKIICITDGVEYLLHDPRDLSGEVKCIDPVLTLEVGKAGSLTFTVAPNHPYKNKINTLKSIIKVVEEGKNDPLFVGRHIGDSYDFYNSGSVTCEGELGYLNDSIQRPFSHEYDDDPFLQELIRVHNSQVEDSKKFTYGKSTLNSGSYERKLETAATTMNTVKTLMTDNGDGYLHVRYENGVRYLDYVKTYGEANSQVVRFGENLLDLTRSTDPTKIITALVPYGANDDNGNPITIASVNNNVDYIVNNDAVAKYGYIWGTETFSDATEPAQLLKKARAHLDEASILTTIIEATAVDMNLVSEDLESFRLGCYTRIISEPHNIDTQMILSKKVLNLNNPEKDTLTFGGELQSFVGSTNKNQTQIGLKVEAISGSLQKDIDRKIDNATQLINGGLGGYVYTHTDSSGHPDEIMFLDTNDYRTAKNVLRINKNGIGFSTTGYTGPFKNAWTIDGNLVASYVTAGSMLADRVRGGTFIVGGTGTGADGQILVQRANGTTVGSFNKEGIKIGGFEVGANGDLSTSDSVIHFGELTYIDDQEADFGNWIFDEDDTLYGPSVEQYWDRNGNLHTAEIYITKGWWKGWSLTDTVQQLWDDHQALYKYVHNGGWNPCSDACKCDGGYCICETNATGDKPCAKYGEIGCCDGNSEDTECYSACYHCVVCSSDCSVDSVGPCDSSCYTSCDGSCYHCVVCSGDS